MRVPKVLLHPPKTLVFWPKNGQIWSKICFFGHFRPNIGIVYPFFNVRPKNNANKVPRWFSVMGVPQLWLPPVKIIRFFGPKTTKFGPKYAFLGTYRPCRFIWCPVAWCPVGLLVGGCGARAVSCKTPIYFFYLIDFLLVHEGCLIAILLARDNNKVLLVLIPLSRGWPLPLLYQLSRWRYSTCLSITFRIIASYHSFFSGLMLSQSH